MNVLESAFIEYQATPDDEFRAYFDEDGDIWHHISAQIDLYFCQFHLKRLEEFTKFILLISKSNLYFKCVFCRIRKICTDDRHNLGKDAK